MNNKKVKKILKNVYPYIIVVIVVIIIRSFFVTPAIVDGNSMNPTLYNNNIIFKDFNFIWAETFTDLL